MYVWRYTGSRFKFRKHSLLTSHKLQQEAMPSSLVIYKLQTRIVTPRTDIIIYIIYIMHALASVCISRTKNEMKRKNGYSVVMALFFYFYFFFYRTAVFVMTTENWIAAGLWVLVPCKLENYTDRRVSGGQWRLPINKANRKKNSKKKNFIHQQVCVRCGTTRAAHGLSFIFWETLQQYIHMHCTPPVNTNHP